MSTSESNVTPQNVASRPVSQNPGAAGGIRNPDSLQETLLGLGSWIEKNAGLVAAIILAVIVAGAGLGIWNWWSYRAETNAQDAYYTIEAKYTKIKEGFDRAKFSAFLPADTTQKPQAASGDLSKDYGSIPSELESFAREYAGTSAGAQAAILAADLYLSYRQPEKAAEIAEIPASSLSQKRLLAHLAKMTWGSALADKGDCQEAVRVWQRVIDSSVAAPLHADASLRSGLCYENLGDATKARELYQKVIAQDESSTTARTAKGLIRALDTKATGTSSSSAAPAGNG